MKVYIAAPYSMRLYEATDIRTALLRAGHDVTSRWIVQSPGEMNHACAQEDLDDVASADVLLSYNPEGWRERGTGGRHIEMGYALALGKRIVMIGPRASVFHYLDQVTVVDTLEEALTWLTSLAQSAAT